MGTYTSVDLTLKLKADTPKGVMVFLRWFMDPSVDYEELNWEESKKMEHAKLKECGISHPFFDTKRYSFVFWGGDGALYESPTFTEGEDGQYTLCVKGGVKNYDDEIKKFAKWIEIYVDAKEGDVLGQWCCETWMSWMPVTMGAGNKLVLPYGKEYDGFC